MRLRALAVLLVLSLAGPAGARAKGAAGAEPFDFLGLDANARAVGLGGAYTALASDSNALLYNPAGLGRIRRHEVTLMHNEYFQSVTQEYLGLATRQGFGLSLNYLRLADINRTTYARPDGGMGSFGISDLAVSAGFGHTFLEHISVGVAGKYISEDIDRFGAKTWAVDGGLLLSVPTLPGLSFGAAVLNAGPDVRFYRDREKLPLTGRGGLSYEHRGTAVAVDVVKERHDEVRVAAGLERVFFKTVALRAGYNGRNDAGIGIVGGAGWTWKGLGVDYAFTPYGELGLGHRISVTFRWGPEKEKRFEEYDRPAPFETKRAAREADEEAASEDEAVPLRVAPAPRQSSVLPAAADTPETRFAEAQRLMDAKDWAAADGALEGAAALLGPDDARRVLYLERKGTLALSRGDAASGRAYFAESLKAAGRLGVGGRHVADAYEGMGRCLLAQGDLDYAARFLRKSFEVEPSLRVKKLLEEVERRQKKSPILNDPKRP